MEGNGKAEADFSASDVESRQLPVLEIPLAGVNVGVRRLENGERHLIVGPVACVFILPWTEEGARHVARELTGGIVIASGLEGLS